MAYPFLYLSRTALNISTQEFEWNCTSSVATKKIKVSHTHIKPRKAKATASG